VEDGLKVPLGLEGPLVAERDELVAVAVAAAENQGQELVQEH